MRKCTNPDVGRMLGLYEFGRLSPIEKEKFENHLLECDFCYQELYDFSPAVKTIRKNIKEFKKAARIEKTTLWQVIDYFLAPPKPVRLAFAAAILFIMAVVSYKIFGPRHEALMTTESIGNNKPTHQGKPHRLIPHEPEEMESKASIDTLHSPGAGKDTMDADIEKKLAQSMRVRIQNGYAFFSWDKIIGAKAYCIDMIINGQAHNLTPPEGIKDTCFSYDLKNIKPHDTDKWRLSVTLENGEKLIAQKHL